MGLDSKNKEIKEMIRIDHAGEYAAKRIYEGQLSSIKCPDAKKKIEKMAKGEEEHLSYFESQINNRRVRPTILYPVIDKLAYAVGAVTAKMGTEAAMVCTSAVEEVIAEHYQNQIDALGSEEKELRENIEKFREEELEHKNTAENYDLERAPAYKILHGVIKGGCKAAIKIVKYL
jgi:ubiquinone biosynthesis monooxygenase Coq7